MPKPNNDTPILELRSLGPACEEELAAVGIHTAGDIRSLGVKQTFELMANSRQQRGGKHSFHAAFLYAIYAAINGLDWRDIPNEKKAEFKAFAKKLRES